MIQFLRISLSILFCWMVYVVIDTSLQSNLFKEWDFLGGIPWMRATLWDFYANILVIYLWILYKEKNIGMKALWAVLLFCLGSIASIGYVLIELFKVDKNADIESVLLRKK